MKGPVFTIKMTFLDDLRKVAVKTLQTGTVVDRYKWNVFCTMLKTFPCSDVFSADDLFHIMTLCCDTCQTEMYHHEEEHEACCGECAKEKSMAEDIIPFIMKEYYHANVRYYNDAMDIWFAHGDTPVIYNYELVDDCLPLENDFYELCKDTCACCSRSISPDDTENKSRYIV